MGIILTLSLFSNSIDSLNMRFVGNWPFGRTDAAVVVDSVRDLLFLGSGGGVYIFDISEPTNPVKVSERIHTQELILDLFYKDGYLYIINRNQGLRVWDVSNISQPEEIVFLPLSGEEENVDMTESIQIVPYSHYFYINSKDGFHIIDISNPEGPEEVEKFCGKMGAIAIQDSLAYVASNYFRVFDISNPLSPSEIGSLYLGKYYYNARSIAVKGSYIYISTRCSSENALRVIDVKDPAHPREIEESNRLFIETRRMVISGPYLYTCEEVVDISDPENVKIVGDLTGKRGMNYDIELYGSYIYQAQYEALRIWDVSNPREPKEVRRYLTPDEIKGMALYEDYLLFSDKHTTHLLSIKDPSCPEEVTSYAFYGVTTTLNNMLYIGRENFYIYDISDPFHPVEKGSCEDLFDWISGIAVSPPYAFIGDFERGIHIVDVSNPEDPEWVGFYHTAPYRIYQLIPRGSYLYLAEAAALYSHIYIDPQGKVGILDISDPAHSDTAGDFYLSVSIDRVMDICFYKSYVYVGCQVYTYRMGSIYILKMETPTRLREIKRIEMDGEVKDMALSYPYLYIANYDKGIRVMDISEPENPEEVGFYKTPGWSNKVAVTGSRIYVANAQFGLQIYQNLLRGMEEPQAQIFKYCDLQISPNPAKGRIDIGYEIPDESPVSLKVYDIQGRLVKTLTRVKNQAPGVYTIKWYGKEENGEILPSGVYFIKLEAKGITRIEKVILMR